MYALTASLYYASVYINLIAYPVYIIDLQGIHVMSSAICNCEREYLMQERQLFSTLQR